METETDWEQGEPCPHCGCEQVSVEVGHEEIFSSKDGDFEFIERGAPLGNMSEPMCVNCEEWL